ncbi:MAG: alcohol dehydrogenase catalytic domain-containing protein [Anaerolineae bacterium]|nr:alcohol dehydrogenase catalytic domain-containing protein [Anaerolineae bacterium]
MRAVIIEKPYQASLIERPMPSITPNQVLVKVGAVGICASDVEVYEGTRPADYVRYPCQPGHEWSGTVVAIGDETTHLKVGDRVAVEGHHFCGKCYFCQRGQTNLCQHYNEFGFTLPGAYADYVAVRADLAHPFSTALPFEVAALTEPAACAGHGLLRANVRPGDNVVVIGPGTIGLLGVAWAKALGAERIIAVGVDRNNETFARSVGATDYITLADNAVNAIRDLTDGHGADVVFESAGNPQAVLLALDLVRRGGTVVQVGIAGGDHHIRLSPDLACLKDLRLHGVFAYTSAVFAETLRRIESGALNVRPLITHRLPLAQFADGLALLKHKPEPVVKVVIVDSDSG